MRLTTFSDYALRVLIYLALRHNQRSTITEISQAYGISRNHLMKIVHALARLGYIDSARGQNGGLRLSRPPEQINLGEVIRHTEDDLKLAECFRADNKCVITPTCQLKNALSEALQAFFSVLDGYQLSDLIADNQKTLRLLRIA